MVPVCAGMCAGEKKYGAGGRKDGMHARTLCCAWMVRVRAAVCAGAEGCGAGGRQDGAHALMRCCAWVVRVRAGVCAGAKGCGARSREEAVAGGVGRGAQCVVCLDAWPRANWAGARVF